LRKYIVVALAGLALLAGCGPQGNKATKAPAKPKGSPYRLAFDAPPAKVNPAGVTIPAIKYTADPDAVERRAILVVKFDATVAGKTDPIVNQMIMAPVDIAGTEGTLPADYIQAADKDLSRFLGAYCVKGKVKISVALARSSLSNTAGDTEIDNKRLSDWVPIELLFKNPHAHC